MTTKQPIKTTLCAAALLAASGTAAQERPADPSLIPSNVAVAHQYMFHHPTYRFPPGWSMQRWGAQIFAWVTAWGASRRLALCR